MTNSQSSVSRERANDYYLDDDRMDDAGGQHECNFCNGDGVIVTCIDDMCRGAGECMHGDGEKYCPNGCGL